MPAGGPLEPAGNGRPRWMAAHRDAVRHPWTEPGVQADSSVVLASPGAGLRKLRCVTGLPRPGGTPGAHQRHARPRPRPAVCAPGSPAKVRVDVQGLRGRVVSEAGLDGLHGLAVPDQQGLVVVSQAVEGLRGRQPGSGELPLRRRRTASAADPLGTPHWHQARVRTTSVTPPARISTRHRGP
jgi:hypothetical protein